MYAMGSKRSIFLCTNTGQGVVMGGKGYCPSIDITVQRGRVHVSGAF